MFMLDLKNFQYVEEYSWYTSQLKVNKFLVEIYVDNEEVQNLEILNDRLNSCISWVKKNYEMIQDYCAYKLFDDIWLENDEKVTKDEFKERLKLESIKIRADGELNISFKGGNIFSDHWIVIDTDTKYNLLDAYLEG
ncbi:MAG: DUF2262 domain-containing protein [Prochloraceae cyanobacterium]